MNFARKKDVFSANVPAHSVIKMLEKRNEREEKCRRDSKVTIFCRWSQCYNRRHAVPYSSYRFGRPSTKGYDRKRFGGMN